MAVRREAWGKILNAAAVHRVSSTGQNISESHDLWGEKGLGKQISSGRKFWSFKQVCCPTLSVLEKQNKEIVYQLMLMVMRKKKKRHLVIFSLKFFGVKALKQIISGKSLFCTVCLLHYLLLFLLSPSPHPTQSCTWASNAGSWQLLHLLASVGGWCPHFQYIFAFCFLCPGAPTLNCCTGQCGLQPSPAAWVFAGQQDVFFTTSHFGSWKSMRRGSCIVV